MNREPRLRFSQEEQSEPKLKHSIHKAQRASQKADKAQKKIPKKTIKARKHTIDPVTGKISVQMYFKEVDKKKPPSKLNHSLRDAPANLLMGSVHRKIHDTEEENVGVESAHKSEEAVETGVRLIREGYHSHKLKPYRKAAQAEQKLKKANINALYQKSLQENPQLSSNPISRWQQKQAIKRQYAVAKKSGHSAKTVKQTAEKTEKAAQKTVEKAEQAGQFVWRHRRGFGIAIVFLAILCLFLNIVSSCSIMFESVGSVITGSTYPSMDADMLGAEAAYADKEAELQDYLDHYESTHDYDEYHFDLDEIKHDPYVLISILTAYYQGEWTLSHVQETLSTLFEKQYSLKEDVVAEDRSSGEVTDDSNSEEDSYDYTICYVTLENFDLSRMPVYIMDENQMSVYAVYMATLGNRPDLFPQGQFPHASEHKDYTDYDVPPEALADEKFAAMLKEAEKYLGFPYVWGGSNPSTSFDCSGYVSWVINHSGWNVGRLGAQGLCNICTPVSAANAKPGDLVFFKGTYDTPGVSHVGIYVGNSMMIHCGDPISYTNLNTSYWQQHLYTYGRLP